MAGLAKQLPPPIPSSPGTDRPSALSCSCATELARLQGSQTLQVPRRSCSLPAQQPLPLGRRPGRPHAGLWMYQSSCFSASLPVSTSFSQLLSRGCSLFCSPSRAAGDVTKSSPVSAQNPGALYMFAQSPVTRQMTVIKLITAGFYCARSADVVGENRQ